MQRNFCLFIAKVGSILLLCGVFVSCFAFFFFFWLVAAWVKSRAERPSVSGVNRQLHVQIGCKLGIRNRKDEFQSKQNETNYKLDQKVIKGVNACRKRKRSS